MMKKKMIMKRICVSLPEEMYDDIRYTSQVTGMSSSRIILLRLRKNKLICLPAIMYDELAELRKDLKIADNSFKFYTILKKIDNLISIILKMQKGEDIDVEIQHEKM